MLLWYESKKLITAPAIVGFCVFCLVLNLLITLGHENLVKDIDRASIPAAENIYETYVAADQAEAFISRYHIPERNAENVRALYAKLQPVTDAKAERGEALSPYFGKLTPYMHSTLFGTLLPAVVAEVCLLAMLLGLLSIGYEYTRNTEHVVYASRTGRGVFRAKLAASVLTALGLFALLLAGTLLPFFARFDFSAVWSDFVSSAYNAAVQAYSRPLITWHNFSVEQYLAAFIIAAIALALVFTLLGFTLGALVRNLYAACMASVSVCGLLVFARSLSPIGSHLRGIVNMSPVGLWLNAGQWFTDGEADIVHAHFETLGLAGSFIIIAIVCALGAVRFRRRELL